MSDPNKAMRELVAAAELAAKRAQIRMHMQNASDDEVGSSLLKAAAAAMTAVAALGLKGSAS